MSPLCHCGTEATHYQWKNGSQVPLCCAHNAEEGYPSTTYHDDCGSGE